MNARAHTSEALVPLEQMLLTHHGVDQGLELLATLSGADLPRWAQQIPLGWRLLDYSDAPKRIASRLQTGRALFDAEILRRDLAVRPWSIAERAAYDALRGESIDNLYSHRLRCRLLTPVQVGYLAPLTPTVAPYLRSCVRGGWRPGLLACTLLDLLALSPAQEEG